MTGTIFNIQKFSIHDGPGIRTTVFLKGCTMACSWCHNPESIARQPEIVFFPNKCIACRRCFGACPTGALRLEGDQRVYDREACRLCGRCAEACYAEAIVVEGREITSEETVAEILKDKPFYDHSDGGATCSGGEPLLQADFVADVFRRCHDAGVHTALDTAGHVPWDRFQVVLPHTDLVLLDLKLIDPERHRQATGVDNARILDNARRLARADLPLWVRIPVIPGHTDDEANIAAIAAFVEPFPNVQQVELLPYHGFAESKYQRLERDYPLAGAQPPGADQMQRLARVIEGHGLKAKAG